MGTNPRQSDVPVWGQAGYAGTAEEYNPRVISEVFTSSIAAATSPHPPILGLGTDGSNSVPFGLELKEGDAIMCTFFVSKVPTDALFGEDNLVTSTLSGNVTTATGY